MQVRVHEVASSEGDLKDRLCSLGLVDLDMFHGKLICVQNNSLLTLLSSMRTFFSRHPFDCGKAIGFEHRIHLTDKRPFHMPYRTVPPCSLPKTEASAL